MSMYFAFSVSSYIYSADPNEAAQGCGYSHEEKVIAENENQARDLFWAKYPTSIKDGIVVRRWPT